MVVLSLLAIAGGMALLVAGAEGLVRGASRIAAAAGVSSLVIGLTVVAFGTSAPELAVSVGDALTGSGGVAIGNAIGSNIFNVLAVIGTGALFGRLVVHQRVVRVDVPLVIALSGLVWWLAADGSLSLREGVLLLAGVVVYTVVTIVLSRREEAAIVAEYEEAFGEDAAPAMGLGMAVLVLGAGLIGLVGGSRLLVVGAVDLAASLGVPDVVIGLTVVAAGTSLPELVTSVVAVRRQELDIAIGNVVGSNLFNILAVLGAASVAGGGLAVPDSVVTGDLPVAFVAMLVVLPVLGVGLVVRRWEGALLLAGYVSYTVVTVLTGIESPAADAALVALLVGLSVVAVVLVAVGLRDRRWYRSDA